MDGDGPPRNIKPRPERCEPGDEVMFSPVMTWMDRALMQVAIVLAALPVVALVAGSLVS